MKTKINLPIFCTLTLLTPVTINMNSKCTTKKPLPTYISKQHRALTLTSSKVYSKVSFTEHTRYIPKNISKKKKSY